MPQEVPARGTTRAKKLPVGSHGIEVLNRGRNILRVKEVKVGFLGGTGREGERERSRGWRRVVCGKGFGGLGGGTDQNR